jgi:hypothetical protein
MSALYYWSVKIIKRNKKYFSELIFERNFFCFCIQLAKIGASTLSTTTLMKMTKGTTRYKINALLKASIWP